MAKRNKRKESLPEGMSRRQAKLAKRAAERAALEKDVRPYAGLAMESDLVALQEFVPSATARIVDGGDLGEVTIATVLPGAAAAWVREDGQKFVALQQQHRSQQQGRDLAAALTWLKDAQPGEQLAGTPAGADVAPLRDLVPAEATLDITSHDDFNWWFGDTDLDPLTAQGLQNANAMIVPSRQVQADVAGSVWWVHPGGDKAHIRWVRSDKERPLLDALARIAARGELHLGEGTKFAGVFRTHGILVPVFDLTPEVACDAYGEELARLDEALAQECANEAQLSAEERRQAANIRSREVTIR